MAWAAAVDPPPGGMSVEVVIALFALAVAAVFLVSPILALVVYARTKALQREMDDLRIQVKALRTWVDRQPKAASPGEAAPAPVATPAPAAASPTAATAAAVPPVPQMPPVPPISPTPPVVAAPLPVPRVASAASAPRPAAAAAASGGEAAA